MKASEYFDRSNRHCVKIGCYIAVFSDNAIKHKTRIPINHIKLKIKSPNNIFTIFEFFQLWVKPVLTEV